MRAKHRSSSALIGPEITITQKNYLKLHETENDPKCLQLKLSQLLLGQKSKVRTVLKSLEQADFKPDLTF